MPLFHSAFPLVHYHGCDELFSGAVGPRRQTQRPDRLLDDKDDADPPQRGTQQEIPAARVLFYALCVVLDSRL